MTSPRSDETGRRARSDETARREISNETTRRSTSGERTRPAPAAPDPWFVRQGPRLRWATWIGVVLIVIRLVAPRPDGWRRWHDADAALSDIEAARTAALISYQAAGRAWPAPGRFGQAPQALLPYLAGDASFGRARYHLAWEYAADTTSGARLIGISVAGGDPQLARVMARRAPAGMPFVVSNGRFIALLASAVGR